MTRKKVGIKSVAKAHVGDEPTNENFRLCILGANTAHYFAPFGGRKNVHARSLFLKAAGLAGGAKLKSSLTDQMRKLQGSLLHRPDRAP